MAYSVRKIIDIIKENEDCTHLSLTLNGNEYYSEFYVFSWRGSYNLPAVEFNKSDFPINIGEIDVLNKLESIHGTQVSGYRGGEYILDKDSPLFFTICESDSGDCVAITSHEVINDTICFYLEPDCY